MAKPGTVKETTIFAGPSNEQFQSLEQQALSFLDFYCRNWNSFTDPQSYIIPPVFQYVNWQIGDSEYDSIEQSETDKGQNAVIKHRSGDLAENVVFEAVRQLIQEKVQTPFIAIHGLNIDRIQHILHKLFPRVDWEQIKPEIKKCFREYDYVLIGPKIGLLLIEVKGSHFTQKKHFASGKKFLPENFKEGLDQLGSMDALAKLLEACTGLKGLRDVEVRKVIFTPNLSRHRFETWLKTLESSHAEEVQQAIGDATCWFSEDMANSPENLSKSPLYTTFHAMLTSSVSPVSRMAYLAYAPILAALSSVIALKQRTYPITLDKLALSEGETILTESQRIERQDAAETAGHTSSQPRSKKAKQQIPDPSAEPASTVNLFNQIIFLTPEQKAALEGPQRQFLIGSAGTGKTIVLQAKALALLSQGQSVLILAADGYKRRYKKLLKSHGFRNFKARRWEKLKSSAWLAMEKDFRDVFYGNPERCSEESLEFLGMYWERQANLRRYAPYQHGAEEPRPLLHGSFPVDEEFKKEQERRTSRIQKAHTYVLEVLKTRPDFLSQTFSWLLAFDVVIVDDAFDEPEDIFLYRSESTHVSLVMMAFAALAHPRKTIWIALDTYLSYSFDHPEHFSYRTVINDIAHLANHGVDGCCFSVKQLNYIMRCPENVYQIAYNQDISRRLTMKPALGHKIQGVHRQRCVQKKHENEGQALDFVKSEVEKILDSLRGSLRLEDIAIVISGASTRNVWAVLLGLCKRMGIATIHRAMNSSFTGYEDCIVSPEAGSERQNKELLRICNWNQVSSLEWPAVIYVDCKPAKPSGQDKPFDIDLFHKYRACSRATAALIEVAAIFGSDRKKEPYKRSRSEPILRFNDKGCCHACVRNQTPKSKTEIVNHAGDARQLVALAEESRRKILIRGKTYNQVSLSNDGLKIYYQHFWKNARTRSYTLSIFDPSITDCRDDFKTRRRNLKHWRTEFGRLRGCNIETMEMPETSSSSSHELHPCPQVARSNSFLELGQLVTTTLSQLSDRRRLNLQMTIITFVESAQSSVPKQLIVGPRLTLADLISTNVQFGKQVAICLETLPTVIAIDLEGSIKALCYENVGSKQ